MSNIIFEGEYYRTVEHAYQSAKTLNLGQKKNIQNANSPGQAKRLGKFVALREDWEQIKINIMRELIRQKFTNPELRAKLLETKDVYLEEGNTWGDRFWGVFLNKGENWLGKILMEVREEIKNETNDIS